MSANSSTAPVGAPAPDFTLPRVGGGEVTLSGLRGKPVVLVFLRGFAWPFCRRHLAQLRDDHQRFEDLGVQVLTISAESLSAGERYLENNPTPITMLVDDDHQVFDAYDVMSKAMSLGQRPAVFVIDGEGVVRYDHIGTQQWQIPKGAEVLELLGQLD